MMLRTRSSLVSLLAIGVLVTGCGDDPAGPGDNPSGSLSFTSTGAVSGQFSAQGALSMTANNQPQFGTWAAADRAGDGSLTVVGFRAGTAPRGDMFVLYIESATGPRTAQICEDDTCPGGAAFVTGMSTNPGDNTFQHFCFLESGSINLQSISNDRARGTFNGAGYCLDQMFNEQPITITNGSFDVPRLQDLDADI